MRCAPLNGIVSNNLIVFQLKICFKECCCLYSNHFFLYLLYDYSCVSSTPLQQKRICHMNHICNLCDLHEFSWCVSSNPKLGKMSLEKTCLSLTDLSVAQICCKLDTTFKSSYKKSWKDSSCHRDTVSVM